MGQQDLFFHKSRHASSFLYEIVLVGSASADAFRGVRGIEPGFGFLEIPVKRVRQGGPYKSGLLRHYGLVGSVPVLSTRSL